MSAILSWLKLNMPKYSTKTIIIVCCTYSIVLDISAYVLVLYGTHTAREMLWYIFKSKSLWSVLHKYLKMLLIYKLDMSI